MDGCYQISWAVLDRVGAVLADLGADFYAVLFAGDFSMPIFSNPFEKTADDRDRRLMINDRWPMTDGQ